MSELSWWSNENECHVNGRTNHEAVEDLSLALFQDATFTGRTFIWSFASEMIARRPVLGWGYQSFWLIGPDAPSVVEAPGFVAIMPTGHNGYIDVLLETGWIGLALLTLVILSAFGRMRYFQRKNFSETWFVLSILCFLIFYNVMESSWFRGFDLAWLIFLIVIADEHRKKAPAPSSGPLPRGRLPAA